MSKFIAANVYNGNVPSILIIDQSDVYQYIIDETGLDFGPSEIDRYLKSNSEFEHLSRDLELSILGTSLNDPNLRVYFKSYKPQVSFKIQPY